MSQLLFQFQLQSRHGAAGDSLSVDFRNGDQEPWQPLEPSLQTPGFRLYLLSLLLCQHHYLVANAIERHLPLAAVDGVLSVTASADWMVEAVSGTLQVRLEAAEGAATPELDEASRAFLERRMKVCPVSRNLPGTVSKSIVVEAA
ncbi:MULTISPECIES: OsmC family protein [unclassified Cyanobium]|uniref:OsmC family protein n=1 Tax=unclassified Cyanobium TaxID=2627006 RepID=UPI0020CBB4ED|nr:MULTISPECIES: OsmC family protein [unclassified Cyanobium]MCP9835741.1 hypothetical protein [Cyanobium sp. La Preciosa 7G6]MCP9938501.1 hypothetical protein [Cyanobium sp. Aljojuca 7A6]